MLGKFCHLILHELIISIDLLEGVAEDFIFALLDIQLVLLEKKLDSP